MSSADEGSDLRWRGRPGPFRALKAENHSPATQLVRSAWKQPLTPSDPQLQDLHLGRPRGRMAPSSPAPPSPCLISGDSSLGLGPAPQAGALLAVLPKLLSLSEGSVLSSEDRSPLSFKVFSGGGPPGLMHP